MASSTGVFFSFPMTATLTGQATADSVFFAGPADSALLQMALGEVAYYLGPLGKKDDSVGALLRELRDDRTRPNRNEITEERLRALLRSFIESHPERYSQMMAPAVRLHRPIETVREEIRRALRKGTVSPLQKPNDPEARPEIPPEWRAPIFKTSALLRGLREVEKKYPGDEKVRDITRGIRHQIVDLDRRIRNGTSPDLTPDHVLHLLDTFWSNLNRGLRMLEINKKVASTRSLRPPPPKKVYDFKLPEKLPRQLVFAKTREEKWKFVGEYAAEIRRRMALRTQWSSREYIDKLMKTGRKNGLFTSEEMYRMLYAYDTENSSPRSGKSKVVEQIYLSIRQKKISRFHKNTLPSEEIPEPLRERIWELLRELNQLSLHDEEFEEKFLRITAAVGGLMAENP